MIFEIDDYIFNITIESISFIELQYLDSILILKTEDEDCQFSFEDIISKELLELIFNLNVEKKIPKFLHDRYLQFVENEQLFDLVLKIKEDL